MTGRKPRVRIAPDAFGPARGASAAELLDEPVTGTTPAGERPRAEAPEADAPAEVSAGVRVEPGGTTRDGGAAGHPQPGAGSHFDGGGVADENPSGTAVDVTAAANGGGGVELDGDAGVDVEGRADRRNIMVSPALLTSLREARRQLNMTNTELWALAYMEGRERHGELFAKAEWEASPFARKRRKRVGVGAQSQLRLTLDGPQRQLLAEEASSAGAESPSAYVEALMWDFLRRHELVRESRPGRRARA